MKKQSATPCYIDYLSKDHNFRQVRKEFTSLVEADGKQYISAGYHIVNRLGYFITEIAWETGNEEFYSE